jgi:hypothetical protein
MFLRGEGDTNDYIPSKLFEEEIVRGISEYGSLVLSLGAEPPLVVMISLLRVRGFRVGAAIGNDPREIQAIDRDDLVVPEVIIDVELNDQQEIAKAIKPAFDSIWNAAGWPSAQSYDADGNWHR